jgi:sugar phosphate isomerase/epimerase
MFKLSICNEVWGKKPIEEVFVTAARQGWDGVEIAPFTLADSTDQIDAGRRRQIVAAAGKAGVSIVGLHWLFVSPPGLHMTTPDDAVRSRTVEYLKSLIDLCADLGGKIMIFGSPKQRNVEPPNTADAARRRLVEGLRAVGPHCQERGVTLCFEALAPAETNLINTIDEAVALIDEVNDPGIDLMLDVKAMASMPDGVVGTIRRFGRRAKHVHVNDPSRHAPGMGPDPIDFKPVLAALAETGFSGWVSCEPFIYEPDPDTVARVALQTLKAAG